VLGWHRKSESFWKILIKEQLFSYFRNGLTEAEKQFEFDLKASIDIRHLFSRKKSLKKDPIIIIFLTPKTSFFPFFSVFQKTKTSIF
jgi:hypothetical protein